MLYNQHRKHAKNIININFISFELSQPAKKKDENENKNKNRHKSKNTSMNKSKNRKQTRRRRRRLATAAALPPARVMKGIRALISATTPLRANRHLTARADRPQTRNLSENDIPLWSLVFPSYLSFFFPFFLLFLKYHHPGLMSCPNRRRVRHDDVTRHTYVPASDRRRTRCKGAYLQQKKETMSYKKYIYIFVFTCFLISNGD